MGSYPVVIINWVHCLGSPGSSTSQILGTFARFSETVLAERERERERDYLDLLQYLLGYQGGFAPPGCPWEEKVQRAVKTAEAAVSVG